MFTPPFATSLTTGPEGDYAGDVYATQAAAVAFCSAYRRGRLGQLLALLRQRPAALVDLATLMDGLTWCGQSSAGTHAVLLDRICGSEHRALDFDAAWRPLQTHTRQRWISVARAYGLGIELPPIELLQIGDRYLVRDGHHRISVACARGQAGDRRPYHGVAYQRGAAMEANQPAAPICAAAVAEGVPWPHARPTAWPTADGTRAARLMVGTAPQLCWSTSSS